MGAHAYVTLVGAGIAITAAAAYLIWVIKILWAVIDRLLTILRAVEGVTETTRPVGPIIDDINRDLDRSAKALEGCVQRLEERRRSAAAIASAPAPARTMVTAAPTRPAATEATTVTEVPASAETVSSGNGPPPAESSPAPAEPPPPPAEPPSWADEPAAPPEPPSRRWWER